MTLPSLGRAKAVGNERAGAMTGFCSCAPVSDRWRWRPKEAIGMGVGMGSEGRV